MEPDYPLPFHVTLLAWTRNERWCPILLLRLTVCASRPGRVGWSLFCCCYCYYPSPMNDIRKVSINYYFQECTVSDPELLCLALALLFATFALITMDYTDWWCWSSSCSRIGSWCCLLYMERCHRTRKMYSRRVHRISVCGKF